MKRASEDDDDDQDDDDACLPEKRFKATIAKMSSYLMCAITQELMVDPVIAADGAVYERDAIATWLVANDTSPLTNLRLDHKTLVAARSVKQQIEDLVSSGVVNDALRQAYVERKNAALERKAQALYKEGKVQEAAELGLVDAQAELARSLGRVEPARAVTWAKKAAAKGNPTGMVALGVYSMQGSGGLPVDRGAAREWFMKAADQGDPDAWYRMGQICFTSPRAADYVAARNWFRKAAEVGHAQGAHALAWMYQNDQDFFHARTWFERSANEGYVPATIAVVNMMVQGQGGAVDVEKAVALLKGAASDARAAAMLRDISRTMDLATAERLGLPVLPRIVEAATVGDIAWQFWLGRYYMQRQDWLIAVSWYEKAAAQGCLMSMNNLGCMFQMGNSQVGKDLNAALRWFRHAAKAKNAVSQSNLAMLLYKSNDMAEARVWFERAAAQDHDRAMTALGTMVVLGEGGARNVNRGVALWKKAASLGNATSRSNLEKWETALRNAGLKVFI